MLRVGKVRPEAIEALAQTPGVKRQLRVVAGAIRKEARRRAPKDTRNLARNIAVENVLDPATGQVEFRVGYRPRAFYGGLVELGTEDTPAQPHLRPAADAVREGLATSTDESA